MVKNGLPEDNFTPENGKKQKNPVEIEKNKAQNLSRDGSGQALSDKSVDDKNFADFCER